MEGAAPVQSETPLKHHMARFQRTLDESAFEVIFAALYRPALAVATQLLQDRGLAEDVVQTAFLKVISKRRTYDSRRPFEPWFYRVLRNTCTDALRRRSTHKELTGQDYALDVAAGAAPCAPDVAEALDSVPADQRAVLELRIVHQMRFPQIAQVLGITEEAAKKRAQRGLRLLRQTYQSPHGGVSRNCDAARMQYREAQVEEEQ